MKTLPSDNFVYGRIMNPVKPVWPPEIRPGCEELPVALTEFPRRDHGRCAAGGDI